MDWQHLPASITGTVDQELLVRNTYLVTKNRILRNQTMSFLAIRDGYRVESWVILSSYTRR